MAIDPCIVPVIHLTKEQEDEGLKTVGYQRDRLNEDLVTIKEWLKEQHHLPDSRMKESDYFIMLFLTSAKGSLEKCKQRMESYYTAKKSSFFQNNDSLSEAQVKAREFFQISVLPRATRTGLRVTVIRIVGPFNQDYVATARHVCHLMEVTVRAHEVSSCGFCLILDLTDVTNEMVTHMSPGLVKEILSIVQDAYPSRLRKVIVFNAPHFAALACNYLLKPFLSKKLRERLIVTSVGHEILENIIPKEVLPKEYGGESESIQTIEDRWTNAVKATRHQMLTVWSETIDDNKRPTNSTKFSANPYFGIHGSIKRLSVD